MIKVTCFGAAGSVTGSNFLLETSNGNKVIIDCGLFQGGKEMEGRNWEEWGYDPGEVLNFILTHAHIDHSGRIPKIVKDGFTGKILTSPPTAELCRVMLLDSAHIQEMEAEWKSRKNRRRAGKEVEPLYTVQDAEDSFRYFVPVESDRVVDLEPGIKFRLRNAGHILGSSIVELWVQDEGRETKIVFSGDLGRGSQLIVNDPTEITDADYLFVESTYGNRLHRTFEESKEELLGAIRSTISYREKVIIPAFALERTQEILYILGEFSRAGQLPKVPIYLDSPLAIKATEIFRRNSKYFDQETQDIIARGIDPFNMPNLRFTSTTSESMRINQTEGPAIVIAGNGMCTAGRIKHHLKHNLWRPSASVIFIGFQAQGTVGRQIVDGAKTVRLFGEKIAVRAKVFTIGGFSSHADQAGLLRWIGGIIRKSKPQVFVIHGESTSSRAFADALKEQFGLDAHVPGRGEVLSLEPRDRVAEALPESIPVVPELQHAAFELAAALETEINRLKQQLSVSGKQFTEDDLERLRDIKNKLQEITPLTHD